MKMIWDFVFTGENWTSVGFTFSRHSQADAQSESRPGQNVSTQWFMKTGFFCTYQHSITELLLLLFLFIQPQRYQQGGSRFRLQNADAQDSFDQIRTSKSAPDAPATTHASPRGTHPAASSISTSTSSSSPVAALSRAHAASLHAHEDASAQCGDWDRQCLRGEALGSHVSSFSLRFHSS